MGMSTNITHPGSARVEVGDGGASLSGSMVDGCNKKEEEEVAGEWQTCSWRDRDVWTAWDSHSVAAPLMIILLSPLDMVRQG